MIYTTESGLEDHQELEKCQATFKYVVCCKFNMSVNVLKENAINSDSKVKVLNLQNPNLTKCNNAVSIVFPIFFIHIISTQIPFLYKQKTCNRLTLIP